MRPIPTAVLTLCVLAAPSVATAQVAELARRPEVTRALEALRAANEWTLTQQIELCTIPAPPFGEEARGAELRRRFEALGLERVRIDAEGNVIGERSGLDPRGPRVVLSAHLDTVFPDTLPMPMTRDGTRIAGPGIGDDCRGLAVILAVARALQQHAVRTPGTVVFVGTVGEEGPGNLRGVRHLFDRQSAGRIDAFISVDGAGWGTTTRAVGSARYRVTYRGLGGHSYGAFGMPNPIHALGRAMAAIADLVVPVSPKTTFNVGVIEGGTSVNSIAMWAAMDVDFRSERQDVLDQVTARFRRAVTEALDAEHARWPASTQRLTVEIEEIGLRPAGAQPDSALIARLAVAAARTAGVTTALEASSTDANYPIGLGIPAVTIDGGGRGGASHSLSEWYDDGPDGWRGPQWAMLLTLALAGGLTAP